MRKSLFCLALLANAGRLSPAAPILQSQTAADFSTTPGCVSSMCAAGPRFWVQVQLGPIPRGTSRSAQDTFQRDFVLTVTDGPAQGFFSPCLLAGADWFQGFAQASAAFGGSSVTPQGRGTFESCGPPSVSRETFTLGTPVTYRVSLSAYASAGSDFSDFAQADAAAAFEGLLFSDSSGRPLDVAFSFDVAPVPEPSPAALLICGLMIVLLLPRFMPHFR